MLGRHAIGHTRYSTAGGDTVANLQPLCMKGHFGWISLAHNGNLVDAKKWTETLENQGSIFQTTTDTEVILHLMAKCKDRNIPEALSAALKEVEGAYSLLVLTKDYLIAVRDPYGLRPLIYGQCKDAHVFASETCAIDLIGGKVLGEVKPGEMVLVNLSTQEIITSEAIAPRKLHRCVFELIYFSRPDSEMFSWPVYEVRRLLGRELACEQPCEADVVVPVPDSGMAAAIGYAEELKIPFDIGIMRSHHSGRSFIQPKQDLRDLSVRLKLSPIKSIIKNKSVAIVDDSLVRGTTSKKIISFLKEFGAKEVHVRISAPPTISPCYYGIDTPTKEELLASKLTIKEMQEFIGADSLGYLSVEGMNSVVGKGFCDACFTKDYPTLVPLRCDKVSSL